MWRSPHLSHIFGTFLEYFELKNYFKNSTWYIYISVFYMGIVLVAFVIACIVYVSASFTQKKFTFLWPLHALRSICGLFVTVLFLPLLDFFLSVLNCIEDKNGRKVHIFFNDVVCFQGEHLIHSLLDVIVIVAFILIS